MTTSGSLTTSSNVCPSALNSKRQSIESCRRPTSSTWSTIRNSSIRENFNCFRRFVASGTSNLRKYRKRQQRSSEDCGIFDNDANIMALSCTAADEEIVPLSPNRAERIVCKNKLGVNQTQPTTQNEYSDQRSKLLKGIFNI